MSTVRTSNSRWGRVCGRRAGDHGRRQGDTGMKCPGGNSCEYVRVCVCWGEKGGYSGGTKDCQQPESPREAGRPQEWVQVPG